MDSPEAPSGRIRSWALTALAVLATLYTLHFAKDFLLPVVLALLLALLLSPIVQGLHRLGLPQAVGSGLVVFGLLAILAAAVYFLSGPAGEWMQQAPGVMRELQSKVAPLQETVEEVNAAASKVEDLAQAGEEPPLVRIEGETLRDTAMEQISTVVGGTAMTVFLLYFFMAAGELMIRNSITALPTWSD